MNTFCGAGARVSVARATMLACEASRLWRAHSTPRTGELVMGSPPPLASTVTLGVQDFSRERDFYQRLGWPVVFKSDGFAVIRLRGAVLALVQPGQLARDADAQAGRSAPVSAARSSSPWTGPVTWTSSPAGRERPAPASPYSIGICRSAHRSHGV